MPNRVIRQEQAAPRECDQCGRATVKKTVQEQKFPYGAGPAQVILGASVPVWGCEACGDQYTDHEAEEIRHEVICRHLHRLTPAELRNLRETYGLSQDEWAAVTGFGSASVKRWETGALIQNEAADRYLRLLADPRVFAKLQALQQRTAARVSRDRFAHLPKALHEQADAFTLHPDNWKQAA
jgi:putative zinc finger/helix-turn-helix YgiT family protein